MGSIQGFRDLIAWQRARLLNKRVYEITQLPPLSRDLDLTRQMRRASVSVMANIAEGFERDGLGDFHRFLTISKASCAELQSHFIACFDAGYFDDQTLRLLLDQSEEVLRILSGLRESVERRRSAARHRAQTGS
jgi:four helix bundle protein